MQARRPAEQIRENLQRTQDAIARAAQGRSVRLVCVTKYAREEWLEPLLLAGATDLGENLLPAGAQRFERLRAAGHSFSAHVLGAQQSRKLKSVASDFDWYQALDSREAAQALNRFSSERQLNVLLQVNIGAEAQKHGVPAQQCSEFCAWLLQECPRLRLRGLMAIPPGPQAYADPGSFEKGSRSCFAALKQMFDKIESAVGPASGVMAWDTLSMGMSQDYVWAIEEGATMVRVGTALFEGLEG